MAIAIIVAIARPVNSQELAEQPTSPIVGRLSAVISASPPSCFESFYHADSPHRSSHDYI